MNKPRVIAAEIKKNFSKDVLHCVKSKPHIAGELELVGCTSSEPHWVEVRDGQLVVYPGVTPNSAPVWRLSLRRLNLHPASSGRPRGFSLTRHGELTPIATFQVENELEYSRWVKTLAAELLKQTPLDAVKFLDILGITATIGEPRRSLSPDYHSEPESHSWSYSPVHRLTPEPPRQAVQTVPRSWIHKPLEVAQPLSLIITEEPKSERSFRRALSYESSSEDSVDGRVRMVDSFCNLAKQSRHCFSSCSPTGDPKPPPRESRVKSLLRAFQSAQKIVKEKSTSSPPHCLDLKDDGRMGRPPLPDVIKDLPPCERRSRARTRTPTPLRIRGKSLDVLPSTEDCQVAELLARCQQEDRYVPVRDKTLLFESLGRTSSQPSILHSSDNLLSSLHEPPCLQPARTQSLHDLSNTNVAVKEICRYFEQRGGSRGELVTRSPSPECRLRISPSGICKSSLDSRRRQSVRTERRLCRLRQNIADSERTIWRLQDQRDKLARGSSARIQRVVEERLDEERLRLKKLQSEQFLAQQELETSGPEHFGISAASTTRHHSNIR